ncbi:MAG: hypothetical protein HZB82_06585 [Deltaproteobacteria bacterium]|nr:hypothetical protein [Deltaproteobacteria bacterium]
MRPGKAINRILLISVMTAVLFSTAYADDLALHGFLQGNYSFDTANANPDKGRLKWSEERGQIRLDGVAEPFHLLIKTDVFYDHIEEKGDGELREGYFDLTRETWDLRVGRQTMTWGLGDLVFINDIFPKDYEAFFSGRPMEYLKKGVNGVKLGLYPGTVSLELVVIPFFEPNRLPDPNRFRMFDPMPGLTNRVKKEPSTSLKNTELALRAYRDLAGFEASLYFYRGFSRTPSMLPDNPSSPSKLTIFYPELSVYGLSLQRSALDGVLSLEAGHYDSREDRSGTDPFIPNSQTKFLIGYQRQMLEDFTAGLQYLGDYMHNYSEYKLNLPAGFPKDPELRQVASVRLTYLLLHQNLKLTWFSFYGITDRDYLLNPEIKYNFTDHVWGAAGANIFGGKKDATQFGSLDKNDNIYVQARYEF